MNGSPIHQLTGNADPITLRMVAWLARSRVAAMAMDQGADPTDQEHPLLIFSDDLERIADAISSRDAL
jgi:hypothetical protein